VRRECAKMRLFLSTLPGASQEHQENRRRRAGTMGNGIAQACAVAGLPVVMTDIAQARSTAG